MTVRRSRELGHTRLAGGMLRCLLALGVVATLAAGCASTPSSQAELPAGDSAAPSVQGGGVRNEAAELGDAPAATPDVLLQFELAQFVVRADDIRGLEPYPTENRSGEPFTTRPFEVVVDELLLINPLYAALDGDPPLASTTVEAVEIPSQSAVSLAVDALGDQDDGESPLVVGLATTRASLAEATNEEFAVMFVAMEQPSGSWSFPGLPDESRAEAVLAALIDATGATSPIGALEAYGREIDASNQLGAGARTDGLSEVYAAVDAVFVEEDVAWGDRAPDERALSVEATPADVLADVEAIGVEFVFADPALEQAESASDVVVSVRSALGITHSFLASVGSHNALALRAQDEVLRLVVVLPDGEEVDVGAIPAVPAGQVAVVRIDGSDPAALTARFVDARALSSSEEAYARSLGINPDGSISR